MSEKDIGPDKIGITSRRDVLKATAALGVGAIAVPAFSDNVRAEETPKEWSDVKNFTNYVDFTVTHSSGLRLYKSWLNDMGTRWEHQFVAAGQCVTEKNGEKQPDIFSNVMVLDESDSCLGSKPGMDAQTQAMYPQPDSSGNTDAEQLTLAVLELVADLAGNTAGVAVLTGTQLLDSLLSAFTSVSGTNPYTWEGAYSNQGGVSEAAHHWEFDITRETTCSSWTSSIMVRSQLGNSQINWDVGFGSGSVGASTSSVVPTGDKHQWGHPKNMSKEDRDHYGVQRVSPGQVRGIDLEANPQKQRFMIRSGNEDIMLRRSEIEQIRDEGPAWIATNPPVTAEASHTVVEQSR